MLPVDYHAFAEVEGSMIEMDQSAAVAEHLFYVKAGVKRALHVHLGSKDSFQLVRFGSKGEPRLWAQDMMAETPRLWAPSELALQKAEDWIDQLVPVERANLVEAVRFALAFKPLWSCDEIYIISSAAFKQSDHEKILSTIRFLNKREAAIHTIGRWETYGEIWRHVAGQRQPFVSSLLVTPFWDTPSDTVSQKLQLLQPSMSETGRLLLVFVFN
ncbi:Uncharacterized protein SCF082_LOCUS36608 [Durusdinium trenchii]|uniref:Uncharacterized protein n=1 Tax=Durusdinium trenchii TaxID=1381693 RepID=A0ABP0PJ36_9DINO